MDDARRRSAAQVLVPDVSESTIDDPARHHLRRVLRLRDGEVVTVTDGAGRWRACRLVGDDLEPEGPVQLEPEPAPTLIVAVAAPKGDRAEWLVQKCTEVGVDRITFVTAERSVVRWDGDRGPRQLERFRRIATEAAMQSRRVWLPQIVGPLAATDVLPSAAVAEPGGRAVRAADSLIAVGPEGGWAPHELAVAGERVALGPNVLRVETAAVVAATLMVAQRSVRS